jgi:hypothetical protein
VIFAVGQPISLHVDGAPNVALYGSTSVPGGSLTQLNANTYELHWNTGESIVVSYQGWYIDWGVKLGPHDAAGSVQGLLGSHGGPSGEFHLPDGTALPHLPSNAEIVGQYADAWRVPGGHSLIDSHSFVDHHAVL